MKKIILVSLYSLLVSCASNFHGYGEFEKFDNKGNNFYKNIIIYSDDGRISRKFALELYNQLKEENVQVQIIQEPKQSGYGFPELSLNEQTSYQILKKN
jgi:hypothetical protein